MVYVTSDLHGLELTKLKALLKKAYFNENDWLFVLGDVIDRQNDGGDAGAHQRGGGRAQDTGTTGLSAGAVYLHGGCAGRPGKGPKARGF